MDNEDTVLTWRPGMKRGVYLLKDHYDTVSRVILELLDRKKSVSLEELIEHARRTPLKPDADMGWILLQVKSDLQARELITVDVVGPHRVQVIRRNRRRRKFRTNVG